MAKSSNDPRKIAVLVALAGVLAVLIVYRVRPAVVGPVAAERPSAGKAGRYDVPALSFGVSTTRTLPTPSSGRNLFTFGAPPTPTPDPRPTPTPAPTLPPRPRPTPTPAGITLPDGNRLPPPPRFSLTYLGWLGPDRLQVAVFRDGDDVLAVPVGEKVKGSFLIRQVGPADVTIGFVGYPDSITTKVPISR